MVIEFLIIFSVLIAVAAVIKIFFAIPAYIAVLAGMALLILYDGITAEGKGR